MKFDRLNYEMSTHCQMPSPFPSYIGFKKSSENEIELPWNENELSYTFVNLLASASYNISVRVNNSIANSEFSETVVCETKPGSPEKVQNFTIEKQAVDINSEYNKTSVFLWLEPCLANGVIDSFHLSSSPKIENFPRVVMYDERKNYYLFTSDELLPDTNYNITIAAVLTPEDESISGEVLNNNYFNQGGCEFHCISLSRK